MHGFSHVNFPSLSRCCDGLPFAVVWLQSIFHVPSKKACDTAPGAKLAANAIRSNLRILTSSFQWISASGVPHCELVQQITEKGTKKIDFSYSVKRRQGLEHRRRIGITKLGNWRHTLSRAIDQFPEVQCRMGQSRSFEGIAVESSRIL